MNAKIVEKLRDTQSLRELPDGREGVDVTLQFMGRVPTVPRPQRKDWLQQHFSSVQRQFEDRLGIKPDSLSVSAQSVEATVPVEDFDEISAQLSRGDVRLAVTELVQVLDPGK
jgi:hypothetical protein